MTAPTTNLQQSPYLREQRQFPNEDVHDLANQVDHMYIDVAQKVNDRIIGLFAVNFPVVTGEKWYFTSQRQQTLRQVYNFTGAGNIAHGINFSTITQFTRCWGDYTDGTNWYGVIWTSSTGLAGQVTFYMTPTNIVVTVDAGAPAVSSGTIILEWLSQF